MDSLELLAREDEYKKLNKQLEKKSESLLKQIENAMQKQDIFSEFSHSLTLSSHHSPNKAAKHYCESPKSDHNTQIKSKKCLKKSTNGLPKKVKSVEVTTKSELEPDHTKIKENSPNNRTMCNCFAEEQRKERLSDDLEFLYAFISVSVQDKMLPPAFLKERATVESVCKFLSTKVKLMQEQIDKLQHTINKQAQLCELHLTRQAELEGERLTLINKSKNAEASAGDVKAKLKAVQKKLEEKDRSFKELRSENDKLSSEVKRLRAKNANVEARCASLEETTDKMRQQLLIAKKAEKDFRDSTRSLSASHEAAIAQLESRFKCAITRSNRQDKLIKNLRDQRDLLIADGALAALESEYSNFLLK